MTNLEIVKSTYEGMNSEENGKNLAKYAANDISWTEAKGFPYAGTYIGLVDRPDNVNHLNRIKVSSVNEVFTIGSFLV